MSGHFPAENIGDGSTAGHHRAEPAHFAFDAQSDGAIEQVLKKYPPARKASAVLPLLYLVQEQMKRETGSAWIPRVGMDAVAVLLEMPPIRVYEVATFYLMFNTSPIGKYHLQVCTTTPCWLRGSDDVVAACRKVTGIKGWHETSEDGLFTLSEVECLGACVNAPILQIDNDFYEDMDGPLTESLLLALKRGDGLPKPGSMIGRVNSAPEGGPMTLTTVTE
jgi:NADH-quinone oxidoreductase subunit E